MSLLTLVQNCLSELSLPTTNFVVGNPNTTVGQMLALANREVKLLRAKYDWPQLRKEHLFTLVPGQAAYPFPTDLDRVIFRTQWERGYKWELIGPLSPQEWQVYKSGITVSGPRQKFTAKVQYDVGAKFFIDPTPDSAESTHVTVFEYQSRSCVRPRTWEAGTYYATGQAVWYDGLSWRANVGGFNAVDAPDTDTPTFVDSSGIIWGRITAVYDSFLTDTDESVISEDVLALGVQARYLRVIGNDDSSLRQEYELLAQREATAIKSAPTLSMTREFPRYLLSPANIPEGNF